VNELALNEAALNEVLFLLGPTACGKTSCSIELAHALNAEIISVDSALVYRDMNIGTAKPDLQERAGVAHHLIDICSPDTAYSVARFCADALRAISDVQSRGKRALLTGGTMLYFNALEKGIAPLPDANPAIRAALSEEADKIGWPAMHAKLLQVDPVAAARIHPNDPQRLQRALEVYELTGCALSDLQKQTSSLLDSVPVKFALLPDDRAWLHQRIGQRFGLMLEAGFLDEMMQLRDAYTLDRNLPSMRSVGYRQAWEHLEGETDLPTMIERAEAATRQLAKRQITWIRGMDALHKIPCDTHSLDQQLDTMLDVLQNRSAAS